MLAYATFILELAHAKSYLQTTSVRKATNDKAKEVHVVAREYKRQKVEQRRSCLKLVLGLQKDQGIKPKIKPQEHSTSEGNKGEEHILSPIKTNPNKLLVHLPNHYHYECYQLLEHP